MAPFVIDIDSRRGYVAGMGGESNGLNSGDRLGRFLILETLGAGGSGAVYRAYDPKLERKVAIKVLPRGNREDALRLRREAQALAQLSHPNVLSVYEVDEDRGTTFLVTELVAGQDLARWLEQPRRWREILDMFLAAGNGLVAAHNVGLVHRDFKPANVLIGKGGRPRVGDFGLARRLADPAVDSDAPTVPVGHRDVALTETGVWLGTPAYMSPEQWRGERADARSDQFSFACALTEALYGEAPFPAATGEGKLDAIQRGPVEPVRHHGVPLPLRRVLVKALSADPADRYADLQTLLDELQAAAVRRRNQWLAAAAASGLVGVFALLITMDPPVDPCVVPTDLGQAWTAEGRAAVRAAFVGTELPYAEQAVQQVFIAVDDYLGRWQQAYGDACAATHVRGEQSVDLLDRRMVCLDSRRRQLDELAAVFKQADASVVRRSAQAVGALPGLAQCADRAALLDQNPLPTDPDARLEMEWLDGLLSRAQVLHDSGQYEAAANALNAHRERALAIDYIPMRARFLSLSGQVASRLDQLAAAIGDLRRARFAALVGGDQNLAARATAEWLWNEGYLQGGYAVGEELAAEASLLLQSESVGAAARGAFFNALGSMRQIQERFDEAIDHLRVAVAEYRSAYGQNSYKVGAGLFNLANALRQRGDANEAARLYTEATSTMAAAVGDQHPVNAILLGGVGGFFHEQGDYAAARDNLQRALEVAELNYGPAHTETAIVLQNLGTLSNTEGRFEDAVRYLSRAVSIIESSGAADSVWLAEAKTPLALAQLELGQPQLALNVLEGADETLTEEQALWRAQILFVRAKAAHQVGQPRAAVTTMLDEAAALANLTEERRLGVSLSEEIIAYRATLDAPSSD